MTKYKIDNLQQIALSGNVDLALQLCNEDYSKYELLNLLIDKLKDLTRDESYMINENKIFHYRYIEVIKYNYSEGTLRIDYLNNNYEIYKAIFIEKLLKILDND